MSEHKLLQSLEQSFQSLNVVRNLALKNDATLLSFLFEKSFYKEEFKQRFLLELQNYSLFKQREFLSFLHLRLLSPGYTKFANKIGLSLKENFLIKDEKVVLNFAFKDCVFKGTASKDAQKSNEIFFNEVLAKDEIDVLFSPKILQNFELIKGLALGNHLQNTGQRSLANDTQVFINKNKSQKAHNQSINQSITQLKDSLNKGNFNLLLKGNNLLALHTLKHRKDIYGQVKLIYIDPPYNTGNDSFNYNDSFNHSTWLTFMKNRLQIAREFLREDGVIFVQCDDNEQAYLKVLMDEIFGRENFVNCVTWHRKRGKDNSAKFLSRVSEYILIFARNIKILTFNKTELEENTLEQYSNPDNDPRGKYRKLALWRRRGQGGSKEYSYTTKEGKFIESRAWLCSEETMKELDVQNKLIVIGNNLYRKLFIAEHEGNIPETIWINLSNTANAKDEIKALFLEQQRAGGLGVGKGDKGVASQVATLVPLTKEQEQGNSQENTPLFATPKPEALLKRIIEISTNENDLVMDFFAGSGTTLVVAHKMNRRYVGIEQMDYIESITKERLKKVIAGEQGGISKALNWQGGGEFIYCELMPLNAGYKEKIINQNDEKELFKLYKELEEKAFVDYRADFSKVEDKEFETLSLEDKKQVLLELLDFNMDYMLLGDLEDKDLNLSDDLIALNKAFYGIKDNNE